MGRDLDSQAPNIITLLLNLHTAGGGVEVEQEGDDVGELLAEGRQGGLAGDPVRLWPCPPGCEVGGWLALLFS